MTKRHPMFDIACKSKPMSRNRIHNSRRTRIRRTAAEARDLVEGLLLLPSDYGGDAPVKDGDGVWRLPRELKYALVEDADDD